MPAQRRAEVRSSGFSLPGSVQPKGWTPCPHKGGPRFGVQALACPESGQPEGWTPCPHKGGPKFGVQALACPESGQPEGWTPCPHKGGPRFGVQALACPGSVRPEGWTPNLFIRHSSFVTRTGILWTMMRFYLIRFPLFAFVVLAVLSSGCGSSKRASETQGSERPASPSAKDAGVPSEDGRRVIAALGDSLTAGLGVDPADNYPSKLQRRLDAGGNKYRVVNAGVSGDTSAQGLSRLASVRALRPEFVILALGANDGLRGLPIESTRRNLETIITELQRDGTRGVLAGLMNPPNYAPEYALAF